MTEPVTDTRADYPHRLDIPTRWMDNDVYGHVNNVIYYSFFDTVINRWLVEEGGLDHQDGETVGLCAESHCAYHAAVAFPDVVEARLRVGRLGRTSVRYEIGIFLPEIERTGGYGLVRARVRGPLDAPAGAADAAAARRARAARAHSGLTSRVDAISHTPSTRRYSSW